MKTLSDALDKLKSNHTHAAGVMSDLRETLERKLNNLENEVSNAAEALSAARAVAAGNPAPGFILPQGLLEALSVFASRLGALNASFGDRANGQANPAIEAIDVRFGAQERFVTEGQDLADWLETFATGLEDQHDRLQHVREHLLAAVQTHFVDRPQSFLEGSAQEVTDWMERVQQDLIDGADTLASSVVGAAEELVEHVRQALVRRLEQQAERVFEQTLESLSADALETIVLAELGASVTAGLSPILPQLIAAKLVLDEIKHLLDLMRMGW
jgi:ABC-type transporter Mla subunit MlaD